MKVRLGCLLLLFSLVLFPVSAFASTWAKTYGGANATDYAESIQQTSDGGYIVAGFTGSYGSGDDIWVLKLTSTGSVSWQKTYGGLVVTMLAPSNKRPTVGSLWPVILIPTAAVAVIFGC